MSTPEERFAALLRDVDVPVRGDGLARIQGRLARRRWTRWIAPVAALAAGGIAASVLVLSGPQDHDTLTVQPASPSASTEPSPLTPSTCPSPAAGEQLCGPSQPSANRYDGPFIWPSNGSESWRSDPAEVAQRFVSDFLGLSNSTVTIVSAGWSSQGKEALVSVGRASVSSLHLEQVDNGWVVTQATGEGGRITAPAFGGSVTSPLDVRGTLDHAVDDNVLLTLRTVAGKQLAQTSAPAGSAVPWSGTLTWSDTSWANGAVIGITRSNKDGAVTRVFAQPVVRATASQVATFAGVVDGHVSTFGTDGSVGRQLTYPPTGSTDVEASFNGTSALVLRLTGSSCQQSLIRVDGHAARTVVPVGTDYLSTPRLSPSGEWSAWVAAPCSGGESRIAVRHGAEPLRFVTHVAGTNVVVEAIADDGTLIAGLGTGARAELLLAPGETSTDQAKPLATASGCGDLRAPAFDGLRPVGWERCGSTVRLMRYDGRGARVSADPVVPLSDAPVRTSLNDGRVLVQLNGGEVARYQEGHLTTVVPNAGCASTPGTKGCVFEASW